MLHKLRRAFQVYLPQFQNRVCAISTRKSCHNKKNTYQLNLLLLNKIRKMQSDEVYKYVYDLVLSKGLKFLTYTKCNTFVFLFYINGKLC